MRLRRRCSWTRLSFGLNISSAISRSCFSKMGMPSIGALHSIIWPVYDTWPACLDHTNPGSRIECVPSDSVLQLGTCLVDTMCVWTPAQQCNWLQLTNCSQTDCQTGCLSKQLQMHKLQIFSRNCSAHVSYDSLQHVCFECVWQEITAEERNRTCLGKC